MVDVKKMTILIIIAGMVLASGCIGESMTKAQVLSAINGINTTKYTETITVTILNITSLENRTAKMVTKMNINGEMDLKKNLMVGNISINDTKSTPPKEPKTFQFYVNGTHAYIGYQGIWQDIPTQEANQMGLLNARLNLEYIKSLIKTRNITITSENGSYRFKTNVTYTGMLKAFNRTLSAWLNESSIKTNKGWVEVYLRKDGTPYMIRTYFNVTISFVAANGEKVTYNMILNDSEELYDINGPIHITAPKGIS